MDTNKGKVYFVGAGPGAVDLVTVRGRRLLDSADVIVYAGSLVNPALLEGAKEGCVVHDSAGMTLEEVIGVLSDASARGWLAVRLHTGDPSLYGAIREQIDRLRALSIDFEVVPGVSSFSAAAAALSAEYTLPGVSQSLIITRAAGRTPVPEGESLASFAAHRASVALFLSSGMIERACGELTTGGYAPDTPTAIVYKASWPEQRIVRGTLSDIAERAAEEKIEKTALILVGDFLGTDYDRSKLYDPSFTHGFREASVDKAPGEGSRGPRPLAGEPQGPHFSSDDLILAAFTEDGVRTALKIRDALGGTVYAPERFAGDGPNAPRALDAPLAAWAGAHFARAVRALVFVSATGIAVRAIAPHIRDKASDPAVVCLDDLGRGVIPLLSGHLGGANELASAIARVTGGQAVVTTATDLRGIQAADSWARERKMAVENPDAIRAVSGAMLASQAVGVAVTEETAAPPWPVTLWLRPKNLVIGIGCKKETPPDDLERAIADFLEDAGVSPLSVAAAASIDRKRGEPAILEWTKARGVPLITYTADELGALEGRFTPSERVKTETGVDNVCERAAVMAARACSGNGRAALTRSKTLYPGIALALAKMRRPKDVAEG